MADQMRALTRLALDELREATGGIGAIHRAIADRAFVGGGVPKLLHDGISGAVYRAVRGGMTVAAHAADAGLSVREPSDVPPAVLGVVNGLQGDALERAGSPLALVMSAHGGEGAPRLAVFVHGLFETELAWGYGGGPTYGERLAADHDLAPVWVRYNSGRCIADNGRSLADLLAGWPHPLEQIVLVGHSMGGLVARSACHVASQRGDDWVRHVSHVVSLGSPHNGAPLEAAVHYAAAALGVMPETRPFARGLRRRSAGIRDLLRGGPEMPLLEGAAHHFVAATVTHSATHPLGRLVGDWLVLHSSASGRGRVAFREQDGLHLGGAHHLALLNHPQVYERLSQWLAPVPLRA